MKYRILAINPGSTSTKIAVYDDHEPLFIKTIQHDAEELTKFDSIIEQYGFRKQFVLKSMDENSVRHDSLAAVVGRGGLVRQLSGGTYRINNKMLEDLKNPYLWGRIHAANLGAFIAKSIADDLHIPSYIVDPVTVDEFHDIARISGVPEIQRQSLLHALNIRYTGYKVANMFNKDFLDCNMVAVHMGGGISVAAIRKGKVIDVNNALLGMGPFSPQRAGALPISDILEMAFSGKYTHKDLITKFSKQSGLIAYLGTDNGLEIEERIKNGDKKAEMIMKAMCYQVSKEIGAYAAVLAGDVDTIFLTGGLAYDKFVVDEISRLVKFIAPIHVLPGENEMEALSQGVARVLKGVEKEKEY